MPKQVYRGALCSSCRERKATHPPGVCMRCWRRLRYNSPEASGDDYRERTRATAARYEKRQRAKRAAEREAAEKASGA